MVNNKEFQRVIVQAARGWIGTPFHHQGRRKGAGADCLGLLAGVAAELGLRARDGAPLALHDTADYSHTPDGAALAKRLGSLLEPAPVAEIGPGDVALFALDGSPRHLGIVSDYDISALTRAPSGRASLSQWERGRVRACGPSHSIGLIHAYAPARKVVEHVLDAWWRERMAGAFRVDGSMMR